MRGVTASLSDASAEGDFLSRPLVMLLVDNSGYMERLPGCVCMTAKCDECLPDCGKAQRNAWTLILAGLTGGWEDFGCEALERTKANGATYDLGYHTPYHRPSPGPQLADGLLDRHETTVRFALATLDGWDTYVGSPPLVPATEFDEEASAGVAGLWSYGPDDGRTGVTHYPNSSKGDFRMDTGIRGPAADDGALYTTASATDPTMGNAHVQSELLRVRPYGGSPVASALDDLYYYFATDPDVEAVPVRDRYVVLLTDAVDDDDYRAYACDCTHNDPAGAAATYCGDNPDGGPCDDPACVNHASHMKCPYPKAEDAARYLVEGRPEPDTLRRPGGPAQVASVAVIGLADYVRAHADAIANAGGTGHARMVHDSSEMRDALDEVIREILRGR